MVECNHLAAPCQATQPTTQGAPLRPGLTPWLVDRFPMRNLSRNFLAVSSTFVLSLGGFALWQESSFVAAAALGALVLLSLLGLTFLLSRRWPEGGAEPAPTTAIASNFAAAIEAADRVGQELNLDVSRGLGAGERLALAALEPDLLLASQLRALSRVYRAVTHDLKAPLNAMVLNLDRLQIALATGEGAAEAEKTQGYLDVLREELERLDRSLFALLAETTPAGSGREEFDVRGTMQEIERLLRPQARLQHVALEAQLPGTAVRIAGQRDRLKQAILNIAINALEAMSEGGELELILEARPDEAEVRIADTGPGIPEEERRRIFDLHYTTKTTGTGIGLYLARSIVEAHGGEIRVENRPGRGSEFRLRLPALGLEG